MMVSHPVQRPLVSVVVPAYNAASTITEAIDSVLAQSIADFEIIVCNDASSDATAERVLAFDDPRVRLITNEVNSGEGASRDRAIDAARGAWIAVLDADDAWAPGRLARLVDAAGQDQNVMVFDNIMVCHHTPGGLLPWRPVRPAWAFGAPPGAVRDVAVQDYIQSERLLIKPLIPRAALVSSKVRHSARRFAADSEYFVRLGIAGLRMRYVAEPMYLYRITPGSATASAGGWHLMRECLEEIAAEEALPEHMAVALRAKIGWLRRHEQLYALADAVRRRHVAEAMRMVARSPWLLSYAPRFLFKRVQYHLHRFRHSVQAPS